MLAKDWPGTVSVGDKSGQKVGSLAKAKCLSDFTKIEKDLDFLRNTKNKIEDRWGWVGSN